MLVECPGFFDKSRVLLVKPAFVGEMQICWFDRFNPTLMKDNDVCWLNPDLLVETPTSMVPLLRKMIRSWSFRPRHLLPPPA